MVPAEAVIGTQEQVPVERRADVDVEDRPIPIEVDGPVQCRKMDRNNDERQRHERKCCTVRCTVDQAVRTFGH